MSDTTLPELTDEQIVAMLQEVDHVARQHDIYEYGLPLGFDNADDRRTPQADMVAAVRASLGLAHPFKKADTTPKDALADLVHRLRFTFAASDTVPSLLQEAADALDRLASSAAPGVKAALVAEAGQWTGDYRRAAWLALMNVADRLGIDLTTEECHASMVAATKKDRA